MKSANAWWAGCGAERHRAAPACGKTGLAPENGPQGVFLLTGPSGTGKTETALALADVLFGGEKSLITINLSEYQEPHTVSQLKGSPPGYVGYGQGGILTEACASVRTAWCCWMKWKSAPRRDEPVLSGLRPALCATAKGVKSTSAIPLS
jgi:hypothetical protein